MPTIRRLLEPQSEGNLETFGDNPVPRILPSDQVDQVWFLDDYHHGQSIDLNKGLIGPVHSWQDGGRDVLNFIKHVLPSLSPESTTRPETLTWESEGMHRRQRKVVGVGHSVGGNAMSVTLTYLRKRVVWETSADGDVGSEQPTLTRMRSMLYS